MAKSGKGSSFPVILLIVGIVVQISTIAIILLFLKDAKAAQKFQEVQEAKASAEWMVPFETLSENETLSPQLYQMDATQTIRSYWHSKDRNLRLTVKSPALKELMARRILMVKEGEAGSHLVLTLYYNPLRLKTPTADDLVPVYQLVRYEKPALAKLYEEQQLALEEKAEEKDVEEVAEEDTEEVTEETSVAEEEEKPLIQESELYYPFTEDQIIEETEDYIIYVEIPYGITDLTLNKEYLTPYLDADSLRGDYGWDEALFYWESTEDESVEEADEGSDTETSEKN